MGSYQTSTDDLQNDDHEFGSFPESKEFQLPVNRNQWHSQNSHLNAIIEDIGYF